MSETRSSLRVALLSAALLATLASGTAAQRAGAFGASRDHPAIAYTSGPTETVVSALNSKIEQGSARLAFDAANGYLRSVLDALAIPIESQVLVYSETSFQARRINMKNPRAVFFNDHVAVGWVRGGDVLEVAAQDPRQGTIFYTIAQTESRAPAFTRNDSCLSCHLSWETRAVPGPIVMSVFPRKSDDEYANGTTIDHATAFADRWGGWYVTGARVPRRQLGNIELLQPRMPNTGPASVPARVSVDGLFDLRGYPTPYSDVVALLVLEHQAHAANLITRAGWEFRQAQHAATSNTRVQEAVEELVDYLLFVDEAPLPSPIRGSSGFAEKFAAQGPRDGKGRSLRELQLDTRLMRYPCSFMVYSPGFQGLPAEVQAAVVRRLGQILSGNDTAKKYAHLSATDRRAILEILGDTAVPSIRHFL